MCLGIPGQVVEMVEGYGDQLALVDVEGARRKVNIGMLPAAPPAGQWVLIHMGFAVETVDADGAARALSGLEMMGRARGDTVPGPAGEEAS
jgi:hydrogenase assembly chaperone HypC/HupF